MAERDKKPPLGGIAVHTDLEALGDWLFFPYGNSTHLAPKSGEEAETVSALQCFSASPGLCACFFFCVQLDLPNVNQYKYTDVI